MRLGSVAGGPMVTLVLGVPPPIKIRPEVGMMGAGSEAPEFHAMNLRSVPPASLADYRDKVILLNVWATWCAPCRVEMPSLERLERKLAGTDFRVVAVSVDEGNKEDVVKFAQELGLTFDILHDQKGDIKRLYQTTGVPES